MFGHFYTTSGSVSVYHIVNMSVILFMEFRERARKERKKDEDGKEEVK
jgi:hypothetical protein